MSNFQFPMSNQIQNQNIKFDILALTLFWKLEIWILKLICLISQKSLK